MTRRQSSQRPTGALKGVWWVGALVWIGVLVACGTDSASKADSVENKVPVEDKAEQRGQGAPAGKGGAQVAVDNIDAPPTFTPTDEKFKDVYKPLDGTWRGKFNIYTDTRGQVDGPRPKALDPEAWKQAPYQLDQTIDVTQVYASESPYFQRVTITDTYADGRVVTSKGVNKVQDGKMYCVVIKPDDTVIHDGDTDGAETILWSRDRKSPLAVEFFRETVKKDTYTIIGWGYYGSDDPGKAPRYFFEATYKRVE